MKDKACAMVMAAFVADALALGAHWIYDTSIIDKRLGRVDRYIDPGKDSYHPTKRAGQFTHYGDQMLLLLETLAESSTFDSAHFSEQWQRMFKSYEGYMDQATRDTLARLDKKIDFAQAGSSSSDFSGAARIAPLIYLFRDDKKRGMAAARAQTALTHNNPLIVSAAAFLAHVTYGVLSGTAPIQAMESAAADLDLPPRILQWISQGISSHNEPTRPVITRFGQMCDISGALAATVHLVARYQNDLENALVENVMAGGDSAARGIATGMVLGAHLGMGSIPPLWLDTLAAKSLVEKLLDTIAFPVI